MVATRNLDFLMSFDGFWTKNFRKKSKNFQFFRYDKNSAAITATLKGVAATANLADLADLLVTAVSYTAPLKTAAQLCLALICGYVGRKEGQRRGG